MATTKKTIHEKLLEIQRELKAPKDQYNKFGNYAYRSNESIIEAIKPLAHKLNCYVVQTDEVIESGGRVYVKATTLLCDADSDSSVHATAFAREDETQKGMSGSQLTGATSSYARKYSANGLFAIDDNRDADATNTHGKQSDDSEKGKKVDERAMNRAKAYVEEGKTADAVIKMMEGSGYTLTSADKKTIKGFEK